MRLRGSCWAVVLVPLIGFATPGFAGADFSAWRTDSTATFVGGGDSVTTVRAVPLLDVPFVPQTGVLCGGAAVAMVMRFWGEAGVDASDFASRAGRSGIRTGVLENAVRDRGWRAFAFSGGLAAARPHLAHGRPVVALVAERFGAQHYIVILGIDGDRVFWHDPARGPERSGTVAAVERRWREAGGWGLLVLPPALVTDRPPQAAESPLEIPAPCRGWIDVGIGLARAGEMNAARMALDKARSICPESAAPLAELAGLAFEAQQWSRAESLATRAVSLDPTNEYAAALLATTQYLQGKETAALAAWNRIAEPHVDLAEIGGLERTRYDIVAEQVDLPSGVLLTADKLRLARRRLESLPGQPTARISYEPIAAGAARVDVRVLEPPRWSLGSPTPVLAAAHALVDRDARLAVTGPGGGGDLWSVRYRWWRPWPVVEGRVEWPRGRGIWQARAGWERQDYGNTSAGVALRSERRLVGLRYARWTTADLQWELGAAAERWSVRGRDVALQAGVERRAAGDRLRLRADASQAQSLAGEAPFTSGSFGVEWRSSARRQHRALRWTAQAGLAAVGAAAPLLAWPAAGTGPGSEILLRAHPRYEDDRLQSGSSGRRLAHGGFETQLWPWPQALAQVGFATFVDVAKPWAGLAGDRPLQTDVGLGLRLQSVVHGDCLRLDVARGIQDGATAVSLGFQVDRSFVP